jgi:hypothetical protein
MDIASRARPQEARAADSVLKALSNVAVLLERTIGEVRGLDSDFEHRLLQAIQDTETTLETQAARRLEEALAEARSRFEEQLKTKVAELTAEWNAERERLTADLKRIMQSATEWETERNRLSSELELLARLQAATQLEAEKAIEAVKAAAESKAGSSVNSETVSREVERVEALVAQISQLIDDPAAELSTVIRKNVERAELQSYLKGIRFAMNGSGGK